MVLHVGDQVLYGKYSGTELEHDGKKYLIMRIHTLFFVFYFLFLIF